MSKRELIDAIERFFGDTSRTADETREGLEDARERIDSLLESL